MSNGDLLTKARRLVVKVGSVLLVEPDTGALHTGWLTGLAADPADCRDLQVFPSSNSLIFQSIMTGLMGSNWSS